MSKNYIPKILLSTTLTSCTYPIAGTWRAVELTNTEGIFTLPYQYDCVFYEYVNNYGQYSSFEDCEYIRYTLVIAPDLSGRIITEDENVDITLNTEDYRNYQISSSIIHLDCNLQGVSLLCTTDVSTIEFVYASR